MDSTRRQARTAGALYLLLAITAPLGLVVVGASYLSVFDKAQLDALTYLFLHLHGQGIMVVAIFWGLWLFPFGMLVIRSGFIPRALGVVLFVAGVPYVVSSFTSLLLPGYAQLVSRFATPLQFGELAIIVWLWIWGARVPPSVKAARVS
jgi:hypothetical protein